jgi:hypothetical protein
MVIRGAAYERRPMDDYSTPIYVARAALSVFGSLGKTVVDPCAGRGNIVRVLRESGRRAVGFDLKRGFDFLSNDPPLRDYDILTNPPYGGGGHLARKFIERALVVTEPWHGRVVLLLPVDFDSGFSRRGVFGDLPAFARKVVLTRRIKWFDGLSGSTNHAWFEWDWSRSSSSGPPIIEYTTGESDAANDRRRGDRGSLGSKSSAPSKPGRRRAEPDAAEQPPSDSSLRLP